jgi:hypothetical protein
MANRSSAEAVSRPLAVTAMHIATANRLWRVQAMLVMI